ncbi:hypothetical protein I79_010102 [Cricetulus griseus]|uniref:Uncharacterized protein n=1 Tax=Cricetulus griseus TaxID=10029 RepID=G3HHI3_CRIGR|nr:hypothetical protein I79_010102 [Cricetulus griseus]
MEDGWLDGHLLACPRVCVQELGYRRPNRMVYLGKLSLATKMYSGWTTCSNTVVSFKHQGPAVNTNLERGNLVNSGRKLQISTRQLVSAHIQAFQDLNAPCCCPGSLSFTSRFLSYLKGTNREWS